MSPPNPTEPETKPEARKPTCTETIVSWDLPGKSHRALDWVLGVVERCVALLLSYVVIMLAWRLLHLPDATLATTAKAIGEHWQPLLILTVPLFYRVVREFVERARKGLGLEAPEKEEKPNPKRPSAGEAA